MQLLTALTFLICIHLKILYNSDMKQSGAKVSYHLLETNRICSVNSPFDSNFHIFYKLLFGATNDVLANIHLDRSKKYDVSMLNLWIRECLIYLHDFQNP